MNLEFDPTTQEYVEIIYEIQKEQKVARVKDVAQKRGVTKASVSTALSLLKKKDLINHETYGLIELTDKGMQLGEELEETHQVIKNFLVNILNIDSDTAEEDACKLEHHISKEVIESLVQFCSFMEAHPENVAEWLNKTNHYS